MSKVRSIESQAARLASVTAFVERTGKASLEHQQYLLAACEGRQRCIEDLLRWLVLTVGIPVREIICGIKCVEGISGRPRHLTLQLAKQSPRTVVAV